MNLRLEGFKTCHKGWIQGWHIRLAVLDLDRSKNYPANFVCLLPMNLRANSKADNTFSKIFGSGSLELAKQLLTKALKTEKDSEIKTEIAKRLELLEPKPAVKVKCNACGKFFEPGRSRFKQSICQECKQKRYSKQEVSAN
jgi:hypothetical protein